jgi:hypothetical protein
MVGIREKKYIYIKNFFSKEEVSILQLYCKKRVYEGFTYDTQSPFAPCYYKDHLMDSFLINKKQKAEEVSGLKLHETYAYWRAYIYKSILMDHTDRKSCEISITACIDNCGVKWPIHMNGNWIDIEIGDAVMYLGCEVLHGRKPFEGVYNAQVFFHYVDQNGPFNSYKGDSAND